MIKRLGYFLCGSITFWVIVAIPARHLWGDTVAVMSAVALLLCLVPTALTLLWAGWAFKGSPERQLAMILGGTAVRLFVVSSVAVTLYSFVPFFRGQNSFWAWLLLFYLFTLAFEVALVLSGRESVNTTAPVQQAVMSRKTFGADGSADHR